VSVPLSYFFDSVIKGYQNNAIWFEEQSGVK